MLERDAGWGGILVDANSVYWPRLAARAALSSSRRGPKTLVVGCLIGGCEEGKIAEFAGGVGRPGEKMRQTRQTKECAGVEGHDLLPGEEQLLYDLLPVEEQLLHDVSQGGSQKIHDEEGVNKKFLPQVPFDTLLSRFGAPSIIDYLSLDVEGYHDQCEVLTEKVLDKYDFRVLTIKRPHSVGRNWETGLPHRLMKRGYIDVELAFKLEHERNVAASPFSKKEHLPCLLRGFPSIGETLWVRAATEDFPGGLDFAEVKRRLEL